MYSLKYYTFHVVWTNEEGELWKALISQKTVLCFQDRPILHLTYKLLLFKSKLRCPQQKKMILLGIRHDAWALTCHSCLNEGCWVMSIYKKWPPHFNWGRGPNPAYPYPVSLENESSTFCRAPGPWRGKVLIESIQIIGFLVFCPIWGFFKLNWSTYEILSCFEGFNL